VAVGIANKLTLVRLGLSPVFVGAFVAGGKAGYAAALAIACVFELTDALDGYLARAKKEMTDFGKLMDPFADSVARFSVFLCFLSGGYTEVWVVALLFYRDAMVAYTRVASARAGVVLSARFSGKLKAVVQGAAIIAVMTLIVLTPANDPLTRKRAHYIMLAVAAVTLWSGVDYVISSLPVMHKLLKKSSEESRGTGQGQ
jgi:CDP-diacylglycerol--glycerol-3-phosphate 3-phosphatidyltransferase